MPLDATSKLDAAETSRGRTNRRLLAGWLFGLCAMVFVMVVLGGATRLTGSGLSIMEWAPLSGALPPMSDAEWQRLYGLYQAIPQYELVNKGFGLAGFKGIFWLEWTHRLWGRLIGLAFALPLAWLCWRRAVPRRLLPRLLLLFVLGGLQGAVGWFMVASGFTADSISVSAIRLVLHLTLAVALYAALLWTALSAGRGHAAAEPGAAEPGGPAWLRRLVGGCCLAVAATMVAGGFVAGLHAGLTYNTFPLMDGRLVPDGYGALRPWMNNLVANVAAVQFNHRLLATGTLLLIAATATLGFRRARSGLPRVSLAGLGATAAMQYALGIATLLWVVPTGLAILHQAAALLVLTAALVALHAQGAGARPRMMAPHGRGSGVRQAGVPTAHVQTHVQTAPQLGREG